MQTNRLGATGLQVSALGFGTAPIAYLETVQEEVASVLNTVLDRGVNVIDTAACYPGSEPAIGKAVAHRRHEYVLVSKCGHCVDDLRGDEYSAPLIEQTVERALRQLQTDHIDVMLLHSCDLATLKKGDALAALVKAREHGKIRFAGYSGDNEAVAYAADLPDVAVIETSVSICDQVNIDGVLPKAKQNGIGVIAKRPVANVAWKDPASQPGIYANYSKPYHERLRQMDIGPTDLGFAAVDDETWSELALRFTLSQSVVHTAIVGTTSRRHVEANIAAIEKGALPDDAVEKLRTAFKRGEREAGETWDGLT